MNNVSTALLDKYGLDVQKRVRRMGAAIDFVHTIEDVECWRRRPEYFPLEYSKRVVCLWNTFEERNGYRYVDLVFRNGRQIEVHRLVA